MTAEGSESESPALAAPTPSAHRPRTNQDWWPNQLDLSVLHNNHPAGDPMGAGFDYATAVAGLDADALKADLVQVMRTSQDWWPADFGHYGPFFIRLSWHAAGTYRVE
ncbi:MAG: catalase/peroxidase HPI, partial [Dermatophilaceae bacterium]